MEKAYIDAKEMSEILGVSSGKSYEIIRELNAELQKMGYITISGKVSRAFFKKKWYYGEEEVS